MKLETITIDGWGGKFTEQGYRVGRFLAVAPSRGLWSSDGDWAVVHVPSGRYAYSKQWRDEFDGFDRFSLKDALRLAEALSRSVKWTGKIRADRRHEAKAKAITRRFITAIRRRDKLATKETTP